jgi:3-methyladenine DNA glycosylase AlkC
MITKLADVPDLVKDGRTRPDAAFPRIRRLAASGHWQEREVAATALVEISKTQAGAVTAEMLRWSGDPDPNVRRASCEGLRELVRLTPEAVAPVLHALRADPSVYVRKSVANLLRDASKKHPAVVLGRCRGWAGSADRHTSWVIREGLKKLDATEPEQVRAILASLPAD